MKDGYVKVAAAVPQITVADCAKNTANILSLIEKARGEGVRVLALPELCVTGATCCDLFAQSTLLAAAAECAESIIAATEGAEMLTIFGMPLRVRGRLYDAAVVAYEGAVLGIVPRSMFRPRSGYALRYFASGAEFGENMYINVFGQDEVIFGRAQVFEAESMPGLCVGVELGEDITAAVPYSATLAANGANIIVNIAASGETVCSQRRRKELICGQSQRLVCGYICAEAGAGESTTDGVFSGNSIIAENGRVLAEDPPFSDNDMIITEIDTQLIESERMRAGDIFSGCPEDDVTATYFEMSLSDAALTRAIARSPFIPDDAAERRERCERILDIQTRALAKRLVHAYAKCAVVAVSGGLDSCLALLVTVRAMDLIGRDRKDIITISMPGFGTTKRTRSNAQILCEELGTSYREIDITEAVRVHFRDIGHDETEHDVTYENSQARERTQIAMDIANKLGGMLVGTGDLSELALGWATYNGDHMSMYGVNASIPKTLVRHVVGYYAELMAEQGEKKLSDTLLDILATPVSPELLPADKDGSIAQKTEDLVGPYELHDFYIYYMLRYGFGPEKLFRMARKAFAGEYDDATLLKWLTTLVRRFFIQQFKRSCSPDGPRVGSVALSPRGALHMPGDASSGDWMLRLEKIKKDINM